MVKQNPHPPLNHLRNELSPYLLKHATNPVDWYPWGEEAFEQARLRDVPVLLSVGYHTCHWCNVMEEESFSDAEVGALLNAHFVCVKVDREERPDVDNLYMAVCQMLTGGGGWPLTAFLTPQRIPFFAATYYPKNSRMGRIGLMELLPRIAHLWATQREELLQSAGQIRAALEHMNHDGSADMRLPDPAALVTQCVEQLKSVFDAEYGGFGQAPKFPVAHQLVLLLRVAHENAEERTHLLEIVERTLCAMRAGGIFDHLGLGFHRYSTDARWLLPHFEKMLYDQALLTLVFAEAYAATGRELYARVVREIISYVLADLLTEEGAFCSARSADSEGQEGRFYVWSYDELRAVLDAQEMLRMEELFHVRPGGNFIDPLHEGPAEPRNVLHVHPDQLDYTKDCRVMSMLTRLYEARRRREAPDLDDKVLTDYNALMIAALARASVVLGEPHYLQAAQRAADFLLQRMRTQDGGLLHRYRLGQASIEGHADDYAYLIFGLIELYEADFDPRYLGQALSLQQYMNREFRDAAQGDYYFTRNGHADLPVRKKEFHDGALPSANSLCMANLLRLARLSGRAAFELEADVLMEALAPRAAESPTAYTSFLSGVVLALGPSSEAVVVGDPQAEDTRQFIAALRERKTPAMVILLKRGDRDEELQACAPFTAEHRMLEGRATVYLCRDHVCQAPVSTLQELQSLLQ